MADNKDIKQNLKTLGLDKQEISVYLYALDRELSGVAEISKETNIPRTTIYRLCDSLSDKGFIEWVIDTNSKKIKAIRPSNFDHILKDKENAYRDSLIAVNSLKTMVPAEVSSIAKTQVRYYQGAEGMKQLLWNTLKADKEIIGYSEFGRIEIVGSKFYNDYVREFKKRGIIDKAITNEKSYDYLRKFVLTKEENVKHQLNDTGIKVISQDIYYVTGDHSIYNNIYSFSYWNNGEIVGVEIENEELVKTHTSIFNILWQIAKPIR